MKEKLLYSRFRIRRPTQMRPARYLLPMLLITLALILGGNVVQAHGSGFYQIRGAQIDPYTIHVWVAPSVLRTGDVEIDTVVLDAEGNPALGTLVRVAIVPLEGEGQPLSSLVGTPDPEYPYARAATFRLDTPGMYRLDVAVSDANGVSSTTSANVQVTTISWPVKAFIGAVGVFSASTLLWLLLLTKAFWIGRTFRRNPKLMRLYAQKAGIKSYVLGGDFNFATLEVYAQHGRASTFMERLNGPLHAPALWLYMLVIVAHWMEHVMQIFQIYAMGWSPANAGGILGVFFPYLIESEILHFVFDFIQWAGIVIFFPGFRGRARTFWIIAMIAQTWHFIEHVLLMGQYLSGYYFYGAAVQTSILQYWFPRAELHFVYNLMVFIPMVFAIHYYVKPKLLLLAAMNAELAEEENRSKA